MNVSIPSDRVLVSILNNGDYITIGSSGVGLNPLRSGLGFNSMVEFELSDGVIAPVSIPSDRVLVSIQQASHEMASG